MINKRVILLLITISLLCITILSVYAIVQDNYISPTPIFYHRILFDTRTKYIIYVGTAYLYLYKTNTTLIKTLPYYYYGFFDGIVVEQYSGVKIFKTKNYYTNLNDAVSEINQYDVIDYDDASNLASLLGSNWESYKNVTITNNQYNFEFSVLQNDNATFLYQDYIQVCSVYNGIKTTYIVEFMILKWLPTNSVPDYIINIGEVNLPLLFILVFIPALIISAIFSRYNLGLEGLVSGLTITSCISYQILLIPLWFVIMIIIIDVTLILAILHQRGVF
jgi:hypothetical protein